MTKMDFWPEHGASGAGFKKALIVSLGKRVFNETLRLQVAASAGELRECDNIRKDYYRTHMANDFYETVSSFKACTDSLQKFNRKQTLHPLRPSENPMFFCRTSASYCHERHMKMA